MPNSKSKIHGQQSDLLSSILAGEILPAMSFDQKVWAVTARIPRGKVVTYGQIAATLGTRGCRAVGAALGRNPHAPAVPCHRVVGSNRRLTGFAGGPPKKAQLLKSEGIRLTADKVPADCLCNVPPSAKV